MFWKLCCSTQSLSFQNSFNKQKYFNLMYLWGLEVNTYFYWNIAPFYFSSLQRLSNIKFRPHLLWQISKCKWTCIKYNSYSYHEKLKEILTDKTLFKFQVCSNSTKSLIPQSQIQNVKTWTGLSLKNMRLHSHTANCSISALNQTVQMKLVGVSPSLSTHKFVLSQFPNPNLDLCIFPIYIHTPTGFNCPMSMLFKALTPMTWSLVLLCSVYILRLHNISYQISLFNINIDIGNVCEHLKYSKNFRQNIDYMHIRYIS